MLRGARPPLPPVNHRELAVAHILHFERPCECRRSSERYRDDVSYATTGA
jgi:hypothetical protein